MHAVVVSQKPDTVLLQSDSDVARSHTQTLSTACFLKLGKRTDVTFDLRNRNLGLTLKVEKIDPLDLGD